MAWIQLGFCKTCRIEARSGAQSHALSGYGFRRFDEGVSALALRQAGGASSGGLPGPASFIVDPVPGDGVLSAVWIALAARGGRRAGALSGLPRPISGWNRCAALPLPMPTGSVRRPCSKTSSRPWSGSWARLMAGAGRRCCASSTRPGCWSASGSPAGRPTAASSCTWSMLRAQTRPSTTP